MKIYAISDLHLCISGAKPMEIFGEHWKNYLDIIKEDWNKKVREDDLVLIAGDISWAMQLEEAKKDLDFFNTLKGKKIIIKGNHDYWWNSISKVRNALPEDVLALQNDAVKIDDVIICGSRGWILPQMQGFSDEDNKIFLREQIRLDMSLAKAKSLQTNNEKIICMMHYPPFMNSKNSTAFTDLLEKYEVFAVVYGHIHGVNKMQKTSEKNNIKYYLTSCDQVENKLVEIY